LWRDEWLSARLRKRQPKALTASGRASLVFSAAGALLLALAILASVAKPALLHPLITSLVILVWTSIAAGLTGIGILLVRELVAASRQRRS
jgi:hypothetical protein